MNKRTTETMTAPPPITPLLSMAVALVFSGCCTNAWSLERLLKDNPSVGTALTFCQLVFITLPMSPECISFQPYPRFKPPVVPIRTWMSQVFVLTSMSLLNNWAFAYRVPLTLQIVFRSAGLAVSMILGYFFMKRRYSYLQVFSVVIVTSGVIIATLSRPATATKTRVDNVTKTGPSTSTQDDVTAGYQYLVGIAMLTASCILTSTLGLLQERTFARYGGNAWREGVFYTHLLSLPTFCLFFKDVISGLRALGTQSEADALFGPTPTTFLSIWGKPLVIPHLYVVLATNVVSQSVCVSGANLLTSEVSAVTTNLILTTRKALSLCISVWYFGQGLTPGLGFGATVVLMGTLLYSYATTAVKRQEASKSVVASTLDTMIKREEGSKGLLLHLNGGPSPAAGGEILLDEDGQGSKGDRSTTAMATSRTQSSRELRRRGADGKVMSSKPPIDSE